MAEFYLKKQKMARDLIHNMVKNAITNDNWLITHDPYPLKIGGFDMQVDLAAESIVAAERDNEKIAIEIKTFAGVSKVYEFHLAVGQFIDYRVGLRVNDPDRTLYVAVTEDIYDDVFLMPFPQLVIAEINLKIIVVNPETQTIVKWIK